MNKQPLTFNNFDWSLVKLVDHRGRVEKKETIIEFSFSSCERLILFGETGRGKTHLAKAILNQYRERMNPNSESSPYRNMERWEFHNAGIKLSEFVEAAELYTVFFEMQPHLETCQDANYDYRQIIKANVLVIDDLGTEKETEAEVFPQGFLKLLNHFMGKLIITTNLSAEKMTKRYGDKIYSRLYQDALIIGVIGEDYRLRNL